MKVLLKEKTKRYDALFMEMNPSEEEIIEEKLYLVEILMACADYASVLEFMSSVDDKENTIIEDYMMTCYSELEQHEELKTVILSLSQARKKQGEMQEPLQRILKNFVL